MREGNNGFHGGEVDGDFSCIAGIGIRSDDDFWTVVSAFDVGFCSFVDGENAVFCAGFDGHVRNGEAVGLGECLHARAFEFKGLVEGTIDADHADEFQDDVLACDVGGLGASQCHFDTIGDFEPCASYRHSDAKVGGADAGRESAEGAVGAGVGVRTDGDHARAYEAFFRKEGMLDADPALFEVVRDVVLAGEVSDDLGQAC